VVYGRKAGAFFRTIEFEFKLVTSHPEEAKARLIERDAKFYKTALFRAFLHLSKEECDSLTLRQYLDYSIILDDVLKIIHAPYLKTE
jgi:hypothetical protein